MDPSIEAEIIRQQRILKRRLYYDKNAEHIRRKQLERYYLKKGDKEDQPRGRKPKPRDVVITVDADGRVKVN